MSKVYKPLLILTLLFCAANIASAQCGSFKNNDFSGNFMSSTSSDQCSSGGLVAEALRPHGFARVSNNGNVELNSTGAIPLPLGEEGFDCTLYYSPARFFGKPAHFPRNLQRGVQA